MASGDRRGPRAADDARYGYDLGPSHSLPDAGAEAGIDLYLNCGLLNAIFAISYLFPNIIELSTSVTNASYNSCGNLSNPFSNGLVKNMFAFNPLL